MAIEVDWRGSELRDRCRGAGLVSSKCKGLRLQSFVMRRVALQVLRNLQEGFLQTFCVPVVIIGSQLTDPWSHQ